MMKILEDILHDVKATIIKYGTNASNDVCNFKCRI